MQELKCLQMEIPEQSSTQVFRHCATISSERLKDPKAHMGSGDTLSVESRTNHLCILDITVIYLKYYLPMYVCVSSYFSCNLYHM